MEAWRDEWRVSRSSSQRQPWSRRGVFLKRNRDAVMILARAAWFIVITSTVAGLLPLTSAQQTLRPGANDYVFNVGDVISSVAGYPTPNCEGNDGMQRGYQMFVDLLDGPKPLYINDINNVNHRIYFNYTHYDDLCNQTAHEQFVNQLLEVDKIDFFLGTGTVTAFFDSNRLQQANKICFLCCASPPSIYSMDNSYTFGMFLPNTRYGQRILRSMSLVDVQRVVMAYREDAVFASSTCQTALRYADETLSILSPNFHIAGVVTYNGAVTPDIMTQLVDAITATDADAVVICENVADSINLTRAVIGMDRYLKALYVTSSPGYSLFGMEFGEAANFVTSSTQWHPAMAFRDPYFGTARQFYDAYNKTFSTPPAYADAGASATAYTLAIAIGQAFSQCDISKANGSVQQLLYNTSAITCYVGNTTRSTPIRTAIPQYGYERVRSALESINAKTFFGQVQFNSRRQNDGRDPATIQIQGGEIACVAPVEVSNGVLIMPIPPPKVIVPWIKSTTGKVVIAVVIVFGTLIAAALVAGLLFWRHHNRMLARQTAAITFADLDVTLAPHVPLVGRPENGRASYRGATVSLVPLVESTHTRDSDRPFDLLVRREANLANLGGMSLAGTATTAGSARLRPLKVLAAEREAQHEKVERLQSQQLDSTEVASGLPGRSSHTLADIGLSRVDEAAVSSQRPRRFTGTGSPATRREPPKKRHSEGSGGFMHLVAAANGGNAITGPNRSSTRRGSDGAPGLSRTASGSRITPAAAQAELPISVADLVQMSGSSTLQSMPPVRSTSDDLQSAPLPTAAPCNVRQLAGGSRSETLPLPSATRGLNPWSAVAPVAAPAAAANSHWLASSASRSANGRTPRSSDGGGGGGGPAYNWGGWGGIAAAAAAGVANSSTADVLPPSPHVEGSSAERLHRQLRSGEPTHPSQGTAAPYIADHTLSHEKNVHRHSTGGSSHTSTNPNGLSSAAADLIAAATMSPLPTRQQQPGGSTSSPPTPTLRHSVGREAGGGNAAAAGAKQRPTASATEQPRNSGSSGMVLGMRGASARQRKPPSRGSSAGERLDSQYIDTSGLQLVMSPGLGTRNLGLREEPLDTDFEDEGCCEHMFGTAVYKLGRLKSWAAGTYQSEVPLRKDSAELAWRLIRLHHSHIVPVLGVVWDFPGLDADTPVLVTEYCDLDSLDLLLENETLHLDVHKKADIAGQIAAGMRFLHAQVPPIVHGSLSLRSVMLDQFFKAKLIVPLRSMRPVNTLIKRTTPQSRTALQFAGSGQAISTKSGGDVTSGVGNNALVAYLGPTRFMSLQQAQNDISILSGNSAMVPPSPPSVPYPPAPGPPSPLLLRAASLPKAPSSPLRTMFPSLDGPPIQPAGPNSAGVASTSAYGSTAFAIQANATSNLAEHVSDVASSSERHSAGKRRRRPVRHKSTLHIAQCEDDVYDYGMLLLGLFCGVEPPSSVGTSRSSLAEPSFGSDLSRPHALLEDRLLRVHDISVPLAELVEECLSTEAHDRPSFDDICVRLEAVWATLRCAGGTGGAPAVLGSGGGGTGGYAGALKGMTRSDDLLYELFPPKIARALQLGEEVVPERYDCVSIMFSDIVGYTEMCSQLAPHEVVDMLHRLYTSFDDLIRELDTNLFKVETIGDAFIAAGNLRQPDPTNHARHLTNFAFMAIETANATAVHLKRSELGYVNMRVGLHAGPVVGSVVGTLNKKFAIFGDAVNQASRMETMSMPNRVHCSKAFADLVKEQWPTLYVQSRGPQQIKGKGVMETFWLMKEPPAVIATNPLANSALAVPDPGASLSPPEIRSGGSGSSRPPTAAANNGPGAILPPDLAAASLTLPRRPSTVQAALPQEVARTSSAIAAAAALQAAAASPAAVLGKRRESLDAGARRAGTFSNANKDTARRKRELINGGAGSSTSPQGV